MHRTLVVVGTVLVLACVLPVGWLQPNQVSALPSPSNPGPDFNGDGFADLAVGVPGEDPHDINSAGSVHVIYGSAYGLAGNYPPVDDQLWSQEQTGISDVGERDDRFGSALAAGDFDGDGFDDLAIGVPSEDLSRTKLDAGAVHILYGTRFGLTATGQRLITEDTPDVPSVARRGDRFGAALAAGDMDRFSQDDLAIGAPGEDLGGVGGLNDGGAVIVLYGAPPPFGLNGLHDAQFWTQDSPGLPGSVEAGDGFGSALLTANLAGSAQADLVIGIPRESQGSLAGAGAVEIIVSSPTGLQIAGAQVWTQDSAGVLGVADAGDGFGTSLTAGDFDNDGRNDLAIGSPREDVLAAEDGAVNVLYGSPFGIGVGGGPDLWFQGSPGIQEDPESGDEMGTALAAGDFDGDGYDDLAIGAPGEKREKDLHLDQVGAGGVNVIEGSASGLSAATDFFLSQDSEGFDASIEGSSESFDRFGSSLLAADFGHVGNTMDLAIGVPGETEEGFLNITRDERAGAVNVLYGRSPRGLNAADDDQFWWEAASSLHESADEDDRFGEALAH
jgi:hypothetical protein